MSSDLLMSKQTIDDESKTKSSVFKNIEPTSDTEEEEEEEANADTETNCSLSSTEVSCQHLV